MTKVYSSDVTIYATVFVKADSPEQARDIMERFVARGAIEVSGDEISNLRFDDPDLPAASLSPAMTMDSLHGELIEEVEI